VPSRRNVRERESVSDTGKRNGLAQRPYASTSARTMKRFRCPSYSAGGERRFGHDDRARARAHVCVCTTRRRGGIFVRFFNFYVGQRMKARWLGYRAIIIIVIVRTRGARRVMTINIIRYVRWRRVYVRTGKDTTTRSTRND